MRLKNGKFEFKTVDSIFGGYFEDCQRLGRQHEVSHFRVLLPAQVDKTELVPMPASMCGLDGASFLQKFGQPKGLPLGVADQEAEAPNDLVLLTLDLIEEPRAKERATKKAESPLAQTPVLKAKMLLTGAMMKTAMTMTLQRGAAKTIMMCWLNLIPRKLSSLNCLGLMS